MNTTPLPMRFTSADMARAHEDWGCNCGPGAIAAVCGLTLDELRPHMGDFERKGYTNPTLMWAVLASLRAAIGVRWTRRLCHRSAAPWFPDYGLALIQWCGPWTAPGASPRAAYRHTHWVGACTKSSGDVGIFDVNCLGNGSGWCRLSDWRGTVVPWLLGECHPTADGRWYVRYIVEIDPSSLLIRSGA